MNCVLLDGLQLSSEDVAAVAAGATVRLAETARARMQVSVDRFEAHGHGDVLRRKWTWLQGAPPSAGDLPRAFIEGHCAGVGPAMPEEHVRALMVVRANVLAQGLSGCRPVIVERLIDLLNRRIHPVVPVAGTVGVGGSVALAHVVRVMVGWGGEADVSGIRLSGADAVASLGELLPTDKEALSLINGSSLTTALAALACHRSRILLWAAEAACTLSFEVARTNVDCLSELALGARRHPGAHGVAQRMRERVKQSELVTREREVGPFSIRCAPAVIGAAWDTLEFVNQVVDRELNSAIDNPLYFVDHDDVVETGNFHGAPVALAMDHLKTALTQLGSIAERRLFRMTYGQLSGLPSFLVRATGENSGLMMAQYTAASLVSECKGLAHPATVDSLPTVQHHEDHVCMGPIASRGALQIVDILMDVIAIELMCGAQGLDFRLDPDDEAPQRAGTGSMEIHAAVRAVVPRWERDRVLHTDLRNLGAAVRRGDFR